MNLLNTILVYMAVLATSAAGTLPSVTAPPMELITPPPLVSTEQVVTPQPVATFAPSSTALIVPPSATQTPVDASMTTVASGDRGQNVRTLQKRLIELGYLGAGEDDGIYGKRTKRAVERFQNYNNLKVDGIAGKNTLTKLYKDPNVILAPIDVGPKPTATLKPTQKPIVTVNVTAFYKDTASKILATENLLFQQGITTYKANSSLVPKDYVLVSDEAVRVTVTADGKANPSSIEFVYSLPATEIPVTEAPATEIPVTEVPATEIPVTEAPATEIPVTEAPATEIPVTEAPVTEIPVTEAPATEIPVTEAPVTEIPVTEAPATEIPVTEAPATEIPVTEAPATEIPVTEAPATEIPVTEAPSPTPEAIGGFYVLPVEKPGAASAASEVYTGPGSEYAAIEENFAIAEGDNVSWYGKTGEWAMVSVPVEAGNTVGYVKLSSAPQDLDLKNLSFDNAEFELGNTAILMDAPGNKGKMQLQLGAGTKVTVLAEIKELGLVYVEAPAAVIGKPVRGFIPRDSLAQ